ncbi:ADP-ribosylarginine hydrolase CG2909-like [Haematobia irritans]|uniref:ADP-ribosylarginine hydrolase CG2909-like n=1 Tax=Haematobia irritans TaxID=7368 RepID=UPI003F4F4B90
MSSVFGKEFEQDWPLFDFDRKVTKFGHKLLLKCRTIEKPDNECSIEDFIAQSEEFPIDFPIHSCRVKSQPKERHPNIQQQICSAYPVIHEKVLFLIIDFLQHKLKYGSRKEKKLYKGMSLIDFVQRLLTKRCISFYGEDDDYLLIDAKTGYGPNYMKVGSKEEVPPLVLNNVLSYDEIKISAFLSVSSMSDFINDGNRANCGIPITDKSKIEPEGLVVGMIGARFERKGLMECQDIVSTKTQNVPENGYGVKSFEPMKKCHKPLATSLNPFKKVDKLVKLQDYRKIWNKFYQEYDHLHEEITKDNKRFGDSLNPFVTFDNLMMKKRYAIAFDMLLLEAEKRAKEAGKLAYIHVVGFGLGVWRAAGQQEKVFLESFYQRLKYLLPFLNNIGVVHFAWFTMNEWGELKDEGFLKSDYHPRGGIKTLLSKRNPNDKLITPDYENMLLIVSYAWDGNAMPGNEFWVRKLQASNDPSTACSTLISELHNPHINRKFVNGNNLHIASADHGVIHIKEYVEHLFSANR